MQVLPRHRQSAAAAAEAMLANPSPLSGLHRLALNICARKRSVPTQPSAGLAGGAGGKENVTPAQPGQERDVSGHPAMPACTQHELLKYSGKANGFGIQAAAVQMPPQQRVGSGVHMGSVCHAFQEDMTHADMTGGV